MVYFMTGADPFGFPTLVRPWDDGSNSMANAKRRLRAAFEFFTKLGVKYWCFHDRLVKCTCAEISYIAYYNHRICQYRIYNYIDLRHYHKSDDFLVTLQLQVPVVSSAIGIYYKQTYL